MALNPDAIPTSEQVRETLFDRFYYPYQKQIFLVGSLLAIAILSVLALREIRVRRQDEQWTRFEAARQAGRANAGSGDANAERAGADERITLLRRLVQDFPDDPVTPFALNEIVSAQTESGRFDEALQTLGDLRTRFPKYPLNSESADSGSGGQKRALADRLESMIKGEKDWAASTKYTHPLPNSQVTALVETTVGSMWIGFYPDQAPAHVAKFMELAKSGYFNGTQVYHVRTGGSAEAPTPMLFEAGSAASRYAGPGADPDPGMHDKDEPGETIEPEDARDTIRHVRGVISAVALPSGESSRRFMVIGAEAGLARYNGQNTPYAMVLDREGSVATLEKICRAPTYGSDPAFDADVEKFRMANHPYPPIWIRRVSLWQDEKLVAGHTWDTKSAGQPTPEPWEATLPPPPKPADFAPKRKDPPPVTPENPTPDVPK